MTFKYREIVIEKTLILEDLSSKIIKHILGLGLDLDTKTLSNKSSSLSLKSKVDLLYDCQKIDKKTYSNLLLIMSIRNQFAHNYNCNTFENLLNFITGIEKKLQSYSNIESNDLNKNLLQGFLNMENEIFNVLIVEYDKILKDYKRQIKNVRAKQKRTRIKHLENYKITSEIDIKKFEPLFRIIIDEERDNGTNETRDLRIHNRIIDMLNKNNYW